MKPYLVILFGAKLILLEEVVTEPIVNTTLGAVEGFSLQSRNFRDFSAFLGIPYAKPPVGELRFQAPQLAEKWTGIRNASSYGNICPQFTFSAMNATGDEDCLSINVFTPYNFTENGALLPVLTYIHGGFFMALSGSNYGPLYFMDHDVILVTFNYRLGVFGFLSTEDDNAPGNAGMKDQVLALKWIQDNIANFGGDPKRVTIYGESAGGAAVHYHLLSPRSQGLFSGAISGSGTAIKVMSLQVSPLKSAQKLAAEVGCGGVSGNSKEMVKCLRSLDASEIAAVSYGFLEILKDPLKIFCPSVESNTTNSSDLAFLTRHPYEILAEGSQQNVVWLTGVNSAEGLIVTSGIFFSDDWTQEINLNWKMLAPDFLLYNRTDTVLTDLITEVYLNLSVSEVIDFRKDMQGFTNIFSDRLYIQGSLDAVKIQSKFTPVYLYYNDYTMESNSLGVGTSHGEELALLFSPPDFTQPIDIGHPDYEQSRIMVDLWVQFVTSPLNMTYKEKHWGPVDSTSSRMDSFIFVNSNRGEQGVAEFSTKVMKRVGFWKEHEIPPYEKN